LKPTIGVIMSVEVDHLDIYGSLDEIIEAFAVFARLIPPATDGGHLLIAHDGAHRTRVAAGLHCAVQTYGFSPSADYHVQFDPETQRVCVNHEGTRLGSWINVMPGEHNALNAATAFITGFIAGGEPDALAESLALFAGLDRRLQFLGHRDHVRVYDDYGHHPTEIDKTLTALRQSDDPARHDGRLICVFQPHQHSRTRFLLDEFATSFSAADIVIVPHIYFVRDSQIEKAKVSASDLVDRLRQRGVAAMHLYPFEAIVEQLEHLCRPGDLLVCMGAGPVWQVAHKYLRLGEPEPQADKADA
ncbi:MAG: UDP-N-acetylmuramate--alanine ligase, partial [Phycisphaerales bacterium]